MKKVRIQSIHLTNFCGIREAKYTFADEGVTTISGANGMGKSTIANAITYVLFGTNTAGVTFEIKTYDSEHNIIPEIPHEAELAILVDGEKTTFKRTLKDTWNGSAVKNTYGYYIDGEVVTAGEYNKAVAAICDDETFRLASSSVYFLSLPWAKQRSILESLVPEITADSIENKDGRYDFVIEALRKKTFDKLVQQTKHRRREIQEQLDHVPFRLSDLEKALPERFEWSSLEEEKKQEEERLAEIQGNMDELLRGNSDKTINELISKKISFATKRKLEMEKSATIMANDAEVRHESDVINARANLSRAENTVSDLQARMNELTETEVHSKKDMRDIEDTVRSLNNMLAKINEDEWQWDDKDSFCPHCGQPLPVNDIHRLKEESRKRFCERKAEDIKKLQIDFDHNQSRYTELKNILSSLDEDRRTTTNQIVKAHQSLKECQSYLDEVVKETPDTAEQLIAKNESYRQVVEEIKGLEQQLTQPASEDGENEMLVKLSEERDRLKSKIGELQEKLNTKAQYERVSELIRNVKDEKVTYQEQLDDIDSKLNVASEYYEQSCRVLEESVNAHFSFVRWSMFQTNLNGERKPFCECYHNGVPYRILNSAAKVNAGIDIAYAIAKHYDISLPIIVDECESINEPIFQGGQQIRFYVTTDPEIKVQYS